MGKTLKSKKATREQTRVSIVTLKKQGLPVKDISILSGVNKSTVNRVWKRYLDTSSFKDEQRSGRPQKLTTRDKRQVVNMLKKSRAKTATEIQKKFSTPNGLKISRYTVSRTLRSFGFVARIKRKKPLLTTQHIKSRFQWAKKYNKWSLEDWKKVIWSDESKFNLSNSDGKEYYWTNKPGHLNKDSVKQTKKYGGGCIMVWCCMTWEGLGYSCKIDTTLDGELYSQILTGELMESIKYYGYHKADIIFQHDNDPKHKSKDATSTIENLGLKVLDWPSQSPDMNPIEHLWDHIERELRKKQKHYSKQNDLWEDLQEILKEKHTEFCRKLISTMPRRVKDLLKAKGHFTRW